MSSIEYAAAYTVQGNTGVSGATITYTNGSDSSTIVNGSNNYSFSSSAASGTITPSLEGYVFSPKSITYTSASHSGSAMNFTAIQTYTIKGSLCSTGVSVALSGESGGSGSVSVVGTNYTVTVPSGWKGTITPTKQNYSFSPASKTYSTAVTSNQTFNFIEMLTISGTLSINGVTITLSDEVGGNGTISIVGSNYTVTVPYGWSGRVTPSKTAYTFAPTAYVYESSLYTNAASQSYQAIPFPAITGSLGTTGATIALSNEAGGSGIASVVGANYTVTVPSGWTGTITPTKPGYVFTPGNNVFSSPVYGSDTFNFTSMQGYAISGSVGTTGVSVALSAETGGSGTVSVVGTDYRVAVPTGWKGTITPTKTGYTFTPASKTYTTSVTSNQTFDFTAAQMFTISGTLGTTGVTLTLSNQSGGLGTVNVIGSNYTVTVPGGWSGTIIPTKTAYTFGPVGNSLQSVWTNAIQNYDAYPYPTITGSLGTSGVSLALSDESGGSGIVSVVGTNYSVSVPPGWTGTLTPTKTGYTFSPANKIYSTPIYPNQTFDFIATQMFTITGSVGTTGVIIGLDAESGGFGLTSVVGTNYTVTVPSGWKGTITPYKNGYIFSPANKVYSTSVTSNQTQDFVPTPIFTISGSVGTTGVNVGLSGETGGTGLVSVVGTNYTVTVPSGWKGTITPTKTDYTFSPPSVTYSTVVNSNQTQDFIAIQMLTITGTMGITGANLVLTNTASTSVSYAGSNYTATVPSGWTGTITPSMTGYTFSPVSLPFTNVTSNMTGQDFIALITISGNAGIPGATLNWHNGTDQTTTADGTGFYSIKVPYNWSGTVTPSKGGYTFSPTSKSYTNVTSVQTTQNYTATAITFTISGNAGIASATLSYTDGTTKTVIADGTGAYSLTVSYFWTGTVTPLKTGYTFNPSDKSYTNVANNQTTQNYTATAISLSISGNAGVAGATLSYTDGTDKTALADETGAYSIPISYNWSGTVTPSKGGYTFSPTSKSYTNVTSIQTAQNYTATAITFTISGNAGIAGATLSYIDGTTKTVIADGTGAYSFTVLYNWSGSVIPSLAYYTFTPASISYTGVLTNQINKNYFAEFNAPTNVITVNVSATGFTTTWNAATTASGFRLDVAQDSLFASMVSGYNNLDLGNVTIFSVTTLNPGSVYYYRLRAYNSLSVSPNSAKQVVATLSAAPVATAATSVTQTGFTANWNKAAGATAYIIEVASDNTFAYMLTGYGGLNVGNLTTIAVNTIKTGTYYYRVRGTNASGTGANSNIIKVALVLNTPSNFSTSHDHFGNIFLSWQYDFSVAPITGFRIYRNGGPGSSVKNNKKITSSVPYDSTMGQVTTYLDKQVTEGYSYTYNIVAFNGDDAISSITDIACQATALAPLKSPANLKGTSQPNGKVLLNWTNNSKSNQGYVIQRSEENDSNFVDLIKVGATDSSYIDTNLKNGIKYYYRVAAYSSTQLSEYSNEISEVGTPATGVANLSMGIPKTYNIYQNYPNPFNPVTKIRFAIPNQSKVKVIVYNLLGAEVAKLADGIFSSGYYEVPFNAAKLCSGIYIYKIDAGSFMQVKKMMLLK